MNLVKLFRMLALVSIASLSLNATTLLYKSFNDIVKESDGIVSGYIDSIEYKKFKDGRIFTFVTIADLSVIDGVYSDNILTLRFSGGYVGDSGMSYAGTPEFILNEKIIAFVKGNGRRIVPIFGWNQGLFKVKEDLSGKSIVTDSVGNRIFGIRNGHIEKEVKTSLGISVVNNSTQRDTVELNAFGGIDENGKPAKDMLIEPVNSDQREPFLEEFFISKINIYLKEIDKKSHRLKTVHINDPISSFSKNTVSTPKTIQEFKVNSVDKIREPHQSKIDVRETKEEI